MALLWPQIGSKTIETYPGNPCSIRVKFINPQTTPQSVSNWTNWNATLTAVSSQDTVTFLVDTSNLATGIVYLALTSAQTLAMKNISRGWNLTVRVNIPNEGDTTIFVGLLEVTT